MALINGQYLEQTGVSADAVALPQRTSLRSVCFVEPTGELKQVCYNAPMMRYEPALGLYVPNDTRWDDHGPYAADGWRFTCKAPTYSARLKDDFNDGVLLEIASPKGATIGVTPLSLDWVNEADEYQNIGTPRRMRGEPLDVIDSKSIGARGRVRYRDAFATRCQMSILARTQSIEKALVIRNFSDLPPIKLDGNTFWLEHSFLYCMGNLTCMVDGEKWNNERAQPLKHVIWRKDDTEIFRWYPPRGHGHDPERTRQEGVFIIEPGPAKGEVVLRSRFPLSWIESGVYPLRMDPTDTFYGDDEALEAYAISNDPNRTNATCYDGSFDLWIAFDDDFVDVWMKRVGLTFDTAPIGDTATITSVTMQLSCGNKVYDDGAWNLMITEADWDWGMTDNQIFAAICTNSNAAVWQSIDGSLTTNTLLSSSALRTAYVNKTGYTTYGLINYDDLVCPTNGWPAAGSSNKAWIEGARDCQASGRYPRLLVTYSASGPPVPVMDYYYNLLH